MVNRYTSFRFLLLFLGSSFAAHATPLTVKEIIANPNTYTVRRQLTTLMKQRGPEQMKAWAALVALERLGGHVSEALDLVQKCRKLCVDHLPKAERESIRDWACAKDAKYSICQGK